MRKKAFDLLTICGEIGESEEMMKLANKKLYALARREGLTEVMSKSKYEKILRQIRDVSNELDSVRSELNKYVV